MDHQKILKQLTLEEKASFLVGSKNMETKGFPHLDIKPLVLSDGPNGIRKEKPQTNLGSNISSTLPATCFPSDNTLAMTWNAPLLE